MILRPITAPEVQWILYGGVLIVIVFVLPHGIVPSLERWIASWAAVRAQARPSRAAAGNSKPARRSMMAAVTAPGEVVLSIEHVARAVSAGSSRCRI